MDWKAPLAEGQKKRPEAHKSLRPWVWSPQQESNLYLALRRRSFYPLNYGEGVGIVAVFQALPLSVGLTLYHPFSLFE